MLILTPFVLCSVAGIGSTSHTLKAVSFLLSLPCEFRYPALSAFVSEWRQRMIRARKRVIRSKLVLVGCGFVSCNCACGFCCLLYCVFVHVVFCADWYWFCSCLDVVVAVIWFRFAHYCVCENKSACAVLLAVSALRLLTSAGRNFALVR